MPLSSRALAILTLAYVAACVAGQSLRALPVHEDFGDDFVAAESERIAAGDRVIQIQEQQKAAGQSWPAGVLIGSDGELQAETIRSFLSRRDDRPLDLPE